MWSHDKRTYQRGDHFQCTAAISEDGENWQEVEVDNLSSGGLAFQYAKEYTVKTILWFDVLVEGLMTEFYVKTRGQICWVKRSAEQYAYGVSFLDLDPDIGIRIDENVLSVKRMGGQRVDE